MEFANLDYAVVDRVAEITMRRAPVGAEEPGTPSELTAHASFPKVPARYRGGSE